MKFQIDWVPQTDLVVVKAQHRLAGGGGPAVELVVVAAAGQLPIVRRPFQAAHLQEMG